MQKTELPSMCVYSSLWRVCERPLSVAHARCGRSSARFWPFFPSSDAKKEEVAQRSSCCFLAKFKTPHFLSSRRQPTVQTKPVIHNYGLCDSRQGRRCRQGHTASVRHPYFQRKKDQPPAAATDGCYKQKRSQ